VFPADSGLFLRKKFFIFRHFSVTKPQSQTLYICKDFYRYLRKGGFAMTHAYIATAAAVLALALAVFSVLSVLPL
jgi:hypothetical protein